MRSLPVWRQTANRKSLENYLCTGFAGKYFSFFQTSTRVTTESMTRKRIGFFAGNTGKYSWVFLSALLQFSYCCFFSYTFRNSCLLRIFHIHLIFISYGQNTPVTKIPIHHIPAKTGERVKLPNFDRRFATEMKPSLFNV